MLLPNTTCSYCKKSIYKSKKCLRLYKNFFCNKKCKGKFDQSKRKLIEIKCTFCNKIFKRHRINKKCKNHFCDRKCTNKYMTINRLWTHYKQNPKKTGDRKNTIFLMCDNTCQICFYNENKKMLDIHHIDHDRKNNTFENLACLCVWCHNEHHRLGIHKNIKSILEFIKEKFIGV